MPTLNSDDILTRFNINDMNLKNEWTFLKNFKSMCPQSIPRREKVLKKSESTSARLIPGLKNYSVKRKKTGLSRPAWQDVNTKVHWPCVRPQHFITRHCLGLPLSL